jgi:hypothetical protein
VETHGFQRLRARTVFWPVLGTLVVIYGLTAAWSLPWSNDAIANALTGWYIGTTGSPVASNHEMLVERRQPGLTPPFVGSSRGPVSQYPPAAAVPPAVGYALVQPDLTLAAAAGVDDAERRTVEYPMPPLWPAVISTVMATAAAIGLLARVFRRLGGSRRSAILAGLLAGTATGAWSVVSNIPWTHGPAMLFLALGLLALSRDRWVWAGLAFGAAILARPHLAVIPAVVGIWVTLARRDWRPMIQMGLTSAVGLALLLAYNYWLWGVVTLTGGYDQGFAENLVSNSVGWYLLNIAGGLLDPERGLLIWAPFLLLLVPAAWLSRSSHPDWTFAASVGGVIYLLIQWRANRFSGGAGFFAYRYPMETLTVMAPSLYLGYCRWVRGRPLAERVLRFTLAASIAAQATGAFLT